MINTLILPMLCILLLFVRIPNVYIFPIDSSLFLTNNLARILGVLIVFLGMFFRSKKTDSRLKKINVFIVIFLVAQTLSVIGAQNINSFLTAYKDIVFGIIVYVALYLYVDKNNIETIIRVLFAICLINLTWELCVYFFPNSVSIWGRTILSYNYFQAFTYELNRGRYFADMLDEAFIPLAVYLLFNKKNGLTHSRSSVLHVLAVIYLVLVSYVVVVSSWRTKFIIFLFSSLTTLLLFWKDIKKIVGYVFAVFLFIALSVYFTYSLSSNRNIFDRVLSPDDGFFATTDVSRMNYWRDALAMGSSHPLLGVGLGNYYDYLTQTAKANNKDSNAQGKKHILIDDPHDLFMSTYAASGILGLSSLVALLGSFLFFDVKALLKRNDSLSKMLIAIFWSMFVYSLFNPWLYFAYLSPLLAIRGIVDANNTYV